MEHRGLGLTAASEKARGFRLFSAARSVAALTRPRRVIHYRSPSNPLHSPQKSKRKTPGIARTKRELTRALRPGSELPDLRAGRGYASRERKKHLVRGAKSRQSRAWNQCGALNGIRPEAVWNQDRRGSGYSLAADAMRGRAAMPYNASGVDSIPSPSVLDKNNGFV